MLLKISWKDYSKAYSDLLGNFDFQKHAGFAGIGFYLRTVFILNSQYILLKEIARAREQFQFESS